MDKAILYLLESSIILTVLYLLYFLTLRKETFFNFNRFLLMGSLIFSLLFPVLNFEFNTSLDAVVVQPIENLSTFRVAYHDVLFESLESIQKNRSNYQINVFGMPLQLSRSIIYAMLFIYITGLLLFLSRMFWAWYRIHKMIVSHQKIVSDGFTLVKISKPVSPFSFFKYVFINEALIGTKEFDHILQHENIHIRQKHSVDLVFVQFIAAFFWFNPVVWRLIKSLKTVHEYIADSKTITTEYSVNEYQALLLRQLINNNSYELAHNFNLTFIKKRIGMMKNQKSGWFGKLKVAVVTLLLVITSIVSVQSNSLIDNKRDTLDDVFYVNFSFFGKELNKDGISYSDMQKTDFTGEEVAYEMSREVYKKFNNPLSAIEFTLVRDDKAVDTFREESIRIKSTLDMQSFFQQATAEDRMIVEMKFSESESKYLSIRFNP